ncbi:MAG TPA: hydantoinase/oxoprolinase family protein, partial [Terriglobales bacterium]|nr:hydantoinase/oxoprolinase family protein [Terriglobales bacterium]
MRPPAILVGIDTGGTFTDLVALAGDRVLVNKVLSTRQDPGQAVLRGLREMLGDLVPAAITYSSTVATNALLERRGARVVLLTTAGFEDVIEIGRQNRPRLYALEPHRVEPLVPVADRLGVRERMLFDGSKQTPLTAASLRPILAAIRRRRPDAVAICLLHSYANGDHETVLAEAVAKITAAPISVSHRLVPEHREYERCSTTVINAYVGPAMGRHLLGLAQAVAPVPLRVMQSNGGAISAEIAAAEAIRTVLSGPAGGVAGAVRVAADLGIERAITFDMGGTSTDVCLIEGAPQLRTEWSIGGLPIKVAALDIHTVGAGGGSIAR